VTPTSIDRISNPAARGPAAVGPDASGLETHRPPRPAGSEAGDPSSFAAALAEARGALHWSAHASQRVERRGIALDAERIGRLERAVEVAAARGGRSSVVWLDRVAYVVDIPTATVVTAVAPNAGKEAVFTNIDSVVIA
jgi:flagellar operon protein